MTLAISEDIIDGVIDVLWSMDRRAVRSCSRVSGIFRVLCQRRLFRSVYLDPRGEGRDERLHLILLVNPLLASFIHSLGIHVQENLCGSSLKTLCGILHMVRSHVQKLSIDGELYHIDEPWNSLHESLQTALISIIAHPSCVKIKLGYVGLPITYLSQSSHLQHLKLTTSGSVTIPDEGFSHSGHGEPISEIQGYLESLVATSTIAAECILRTLHNPRQLCPLSLSRLKVFELRLIKPSCPLIQDILNLAADYLQEISLYTIFDGYLDFSRLRHLRILNLAFECIPDLQPGVCIIRVIETLPDGLSELVIRIGGHPLPFVRASEVREIDALLAHERHSELDFEFHGF
ncbi:hypothetical protein FPV67DRAFT_1677189 [Lyophyllum atratum]|nr:hypothetical protein FPV67DRAFT_1677189 [Lyophyllum atratum]